MARLQQPRTSTLVAVFVGLFSALVVSHLLAQALFAFVWKEPVRWPEATVVWEHREPAEWRAAVSDAANLWNAAGANFKFQEGASANYVIDKNRGLDSGRLGMTFLKFTNGVIQSGYTEINTNYSFTTTNEATKFDLKTLMVHEFGHWLPLDHTENPLDVMFPTSPPVPAPNSVRGLTADDVSGIKGIYGTGGARPPFLSTPADNGADMAAALYQYPDYLGPWCGLNAEGWTNACNGVESGAASLRIRSGWSAKVFKGQNRTGASKCFTASDADFANDTYSDGSAVLKNVGSLYLYANADCGASNPDSSDLTYPVVLYQDANFSGSWCGMQAEGWTNVCTGFDDRASAVRVRAGWSTRLWRDANRQGATVCLAADDPDFADNSFQDGSPLNEQVSSMQIWADTTCGGSASPPTATATPAATTTPVATSTPSATATPANTPSATATPSPTGTPGNPADMVSLPAARMVGLGVDLSWTLPAGATQVHLQLIPANNDGPGVNVIVDATNGFSVPEPKPGEGPYVMLPGMGYTWRVRTSRATVSISDTDASWGPWTTGTFRTPAPNSGTIRAVAPADGGTAAAGPVLLQWANSAPNVFYYELQVSPDPTFNTDPGTATTFVWMNLVHGGATTPNNSYRTPDLPAGAKVYWRVRPRVQGDGTPVAWGATYSFTLR